MTNHSNTNPNDNHPDGLRGGEDMAAGSAAVEWMLRARAAGHPVLGVRPGRLRLRPVPVPTFETPINDVLEFERERARARVAWVHAILPTSGELLVLGEAVRAPVTVATRPGLSARFRSGRATRHGQLPATAVAPVGPLAVSETLDGVTVHVLELPVSWLSRPVTVVRRPAHPGGASGRVVPGCDAA